MGRFAQLLKTGPISGFRLRTKLLLLALTTLVLPWAERPWHVAQDSVLRVNREMLQAVQQGRPAATSAEDNFKTFALVEAAYDKAGKVKP